MSTTGKEYKLAIRIAGIIDKSFTTSLAAANTSLKATLLSVDRDFTMLDKGFNKIVNVGQKCFSAIATAAGVATLAIGATTAAATKVGSEFEAQMSTVKAISGATNDDMTKLNAKARELAQTSVFSATEVGNAMEYMGMAGWKTEEIIAGIDGVLDLAAASGEDFSLVSDIVTDDLTAFNMTAGETQRMVDVMAQAAMNSNTNVELMGETFKYAGTVAGALNYNIEDVAIATGLMASSAVKGSMAGTTLRNIMTRMAKPTRESAEAMEALGLSLEKNDGSMYSFMEIMQQIREGMSGMTKTRKAYYAAELAGQRGMTGLLAIANASEEEFQQLTDAIYNAEGAAQKMAEIRLDNLSGDVEIFKDTLNDAGIELYYQFNDQLRDVVQFGTEAVNSAKVSIPRAFQEISAEFPTMQRKFKKYGEPVFEGITDAGKWIVKNGKGIISVLSGVGAAMAGYKVASTGVHTVTALMKFFTNVNPVTIGILSVVGAIGALTTAVVAYKQHEAEMVDNNLAEHFGNIALSMEDIQQVAEYIVRTESLESVRNALEAFEEVDLSASEMTDLAKELAKLNWKVSIGMGLSESEQGEYKEAITDYVAAAAAYAEESQYAVHLNLASGLGDESLAAKVNQFYQDSYNEMVSLGESLSNAVNEAFADNILDPEEMDSIADIQAKMADLQKTLATSEFDAQLSLIGMEYSGGGELTPDAFQNLQLAISEQMEEAKKVYDEAYTKNYANIQAAYKAGDYLTDEEYQNAIDDLNQQYAKDVSELEAKGVNFQLDTILQQYSEELGPVIEEYQKGMEEALNGYRNYDWESDFGESYASMYSWFHDVMTSDALDTETRKALQKLLDAMQPSMEQMEGTRAKFEELGVDMAEAVQEGFYSYNLLGALANNLGLIGEEGSYLLGQEMGKSGLWNSFYGNMFSSVGGNGLSAPSEIDSIKQGVRDVQGIGHRANGGLATRPELTWFAENGPEMAIPIDGSRNAISLWEQTGRLLGMDSVLDRMDLGGGVGPTIEYSPTLQFYGEAPSRDDMVDALRISQDDFDSLMERYLKTHGRVAFG